MAGGTEADSGVKELRIKLTDRSFLAALTGEFFETAKNAVDELDLFKGDGFLSAIPFGKIAGFIGKKIVTIKDENKAFRKLFQLAYFLTFSNALVRYRIGGAVVSFKLSRLRDKLSGDFKAHEFDIENIPESEIAGIYNRVFREFLGDLGLEEEKQAKIFHYIEDYLTLNYLDAAEKLGTSFSVINRYFNSGKYREGLRLKKLHRYFRDNRNLFTEPVLGDERGLTLKELYVEPEFFIYKNSLAPGSGSRKEKRGGAADEFLKVREELFKGSIHKLLEDILNRRRQSWLRGPGSRAVFLLGYPGQGKSSFCKKLLYDYTGETGEPGRRGKIFFIRFKDIADSGALQQDPLNTLRGYVERQTGTAIDESVFNSSVLVLDGLDELFMKNNMDRADIDRICQALLREADLKGELFLVITSRKGYLDLSRLPPSRSIILELREFDLARQIQWLGRYRKYYSSSVLDEDLLRRYHEAGEFFHIKELLGQPILLHMIATLDLELKEDMERGEIYEKLFDTLIERKWEKEGQIFNLAQLTKEDLKQFLNTTALGIWQSEFEYIHKKDLLAKEGARMVLEKMEKNNPGYALKSMMIAFYFREVCPNEEDEGYCDNEYALEFLHKSLYEYLAAEKLWDEILSFADKSARRGLYTIGSDEHALEHLHNLFSHKLLSREVARYLVEKIGQALPGLREELADRLNHFFSYFLSKQFLCFFDSRTEKDPVDKALNTFYGFWLVLSHLNVRRNFITPEIREPFNKMIRYQSQRYPETFLIWNFSFQDLGKCNLASLPLNGADFRGSILIEAILDETRLNNADLSGADLSFARLNKVRAEGADFSDTRLDGVSSNGGKFMGAVFNRSTFKKGKWTDAVFEESSFLDSHLDRSGFKGCAFSCSSFEGASLVETSLERGDFRKCCFREADFSAAQIHGGIFCGADFSMAEFDRASFIGVDFRRVPGLTLWSLSKCKVIRGCFFDPSLAEDLEQGARHF